MRAEVLVDYLTFTVLRRGATVGEVIATYLHLNPDMFTPQPYGLNGYNKSLALGDIRVMYNEGEGVREDMGICVSMSGNGCRLFEKMTGWTGADKFAPLLRMLAEGDDCHLTRIDIACDDKTGQLDMETMREKVQRHEINSRTKRHTEIRDMDGKTVCGDTLYIGSKSSDFLIRIYDKAAEQGVSGHWIRVEMRIKGKNAQSVAEKYQNYDTVGAFAAEILNNKFSFIERDDSNTSRCSVSVFWRSFVEAVEQVELWTRHAVQHPIEKVLTWISQSLGPSLCMVLDTYGMSELYRIAEASRGRLSGAQEALISDWRVQNTSNIPLPVPAIPAGTAAC